MNKKNTNENGNIIIRAMASIARKAATNDDSELCFVFLHQPKVPPNMKERLRKINK